MYLKSKKQRRCDGQKDLHGFRFKEEYKKLKTPDDRKVLAKKLLEQASDSSNTPAMVYALIAESARIAGEAGDIAMIVEASALYVQKFEGDDITARWNMLEAAEKVASKPNLNSRMWKETTSSSGICA